MRNPKRLVEKSCGAIESLHQKLLVFSHLVFSPMFFKPQIEKRI